MKHQNLVFCISLFLSSALASMPFQREPIRVGGNVQESKLIYKVEPVYPEAAVAANVSGFVILEVTISERGEVTNVRVRRGHPLLEQSTIDAVRQWRYSPTYLNGEAVPVIATVAVIYKIAGQVVLDEFAILRDPERGLEGDALIQKLKESRGTVVVKPSATAPFHLVEEKFRALQEQGIQTVATGGIYAFHNGRLFYVTPGLAAEPELALDMEYLVDTACASERLPTSIDLDSSGIILAYKLFLSETGKVLFVQRLRASEIPEVEAELVRTHVITPALVGANPVPAVVTVEIAIEYERLN